MRAWINVIAVSTLVMANARAEEGVQLERVFVMGEGEHASPPELTTTTVSASGSRQQLGRQVVVIGRDGVATSIDESKKTRKSWSAADSTRLNEFAASFIGIDTTLLSEGPLSMPLQAGAQTVKVGAWQATVHSATKNGMSVRVSCAEGVVPAALRERALRAEFQLSKQLVLVPFEKLLALPGYPVEIELRMKGDDGESIIRETLREAKPVQTEADWLAISPDSASPHATGGQADGSTRPPN